MDLLLKAIKHYIPLSAKDEATIHALFKQKTLKKGEHLLEAGHICRYVFFIESGLVRYYTTSDGEEQSASTVNIQALEDTVVWMISYAGLQKLYQTVEHGERFGRLAIEQVYVTAISQITSLYTDSPEVRYHKFLTSYPDIRQRIPQYYIASYVGVKPQSLSRIRKRIAAKR
jgi:CRP-like cAMP-binding protein